MIDKRIIIVFFLSCLTSFSSLYGQFEEIKQIDSSILETQELKFEVLELKREVNQLNNKIGSYKNEIKGLKREVGSLSTQSHKSKEEYDRLENYAKQLLGKNDSLAQVKNALLRANFELLDSKESVEIAAIALQEVLSNERRKAKKNISNFQVSYSDACTNITHQTNKGLVLLDDINQHKLKWIEDLNLMVNTCFAMPNDVAMTRVKVFFYLYRESDFQRVAPVESSVPIVLKPVSESIEENALVYYEGNTTITLPEPMGRSLNSNFFYEVEFQENIIADGTFRID